MKNTRVVFMGTPLFAVNILKVLEENFNVVLVVSQPDKEFGRKKELQSSPVKIEATLNNIKVFTPYKIREDYQDIIDAKPDLIVTCAYGQIIPKEVLDIPKYGCINVHASLLPKYRGGAPIEHAIMNGDEVTGITIMYMDEGMDTGDIIESKSIPIKLEDNLDSLSEKLSVLGSKLLIEVLPNVIDGTAKRIKQDSDLVSFAHIIKRSDEIIDFNKNTKEVYDKVRALSTKPCAYFRLNGKIIKVYESRMSDKVYSKPGVIENIYSDGFGISTIDGEIIITKLQVEGKKEMCGKDYLNGIDKNRLKGSVIDDRVD